MSRILVHVCNGQYDLATSNWMSPTIPGLASSMMQSALASTFTHVVSPTDSYVLAYILPVLWILASVNRHYVYQPRRGECDELARNATLPSRLSRSHIAGVGIEPTTLLLMRQAS